MALQPLPHQPGWWNGWLSPLPSGWGPKAYVPCRFPQCPGWPDLGLSLRSHLPTVRKRPGIWQHPLPMWGRVRLLATHLGVGERQLETSGSCSTRGRWDHGDRLHMQTESRPSLSR